MKKREVIKKQSDFDFIIQKGKKTKNKYYNVFYVNYDNEETLFGLAVSKKLGNAVFRNKCKRQLRNIIDNNKFIFQKSTKYIIMIKKEFISLSFEEKEINFINLIKGDKKINEK